MENKIEKISQLLEESTLNITSSIDNWKAFLKSSTEFYKYSFTDQLLITSQRPNATMCASFNLWTGKLSRRIKQNSKGIPLLSEYNGKKSIRFVFNISDTIEQPNSVKVGVWHMNPNYEDSIVKKLSESNGISNAYTLNDLISERTEQLLPQTIENYLPEIMSNKENSLLEELDGLNCKVWLENALRNSVIYATALRCGIEPEIEDEDFRQIGDFNTINVITQLGKAVNEISATILKEIEREVKTYDRQQQLELSGNEHTYGENDRRNEAFLQRGTEQIPSSVHNREQRDLRNRQSNSGILSDVGNRQRRELRNGNVGQKEAPISEIGEAGNIRNIDDKRSLGASDTDRQASLRNGGQADRGNEQSRGDNRGTESPKSDGMGKPNEQLEKPSERNSEP